MHSSWQPLAQTPILLDNNLHALQVLYPRQGTRRIEGRRKLVIVREAC